MPREPEGPVDQGAEQGHRCRGRCVAGSDGACTLSGDGSLRRLRVEAPADCMINGIAADARALYANCARIHGGNNPLLPEWVYDVDDLEQAKFFTLSRLLLAEMTGHVDSFVLRAELTGEPSFDRVVAQGRTRMFANGLAIDEAGTAGRPGDSLRRQQLPG